MSRIAEQLARVRARIDAAAFAVGRDPATVQLLAVSKTHPASAVREAVAAGLSQFGESRVQELRTKALEFQGIPLRWHMIGSVQTNKVKELLRTDGLVLVQSLDRPRLADALQEGLATLGRRLEVLLQIDATGEETKHGVRPADAAGLLCHVVRQCPALAPVGVMAMGPLVGDPGPVFAAVASVQAGLRDKSGLALPILSLGMSGDLEAAVAAGSTMVRLGSALFGDRG